MAASLEITASEFLQGSRNWNFFLPKSLSKSRNTYLLVGLSDRKRSGCLRTCSTGVQRNASERVKAVVSVDKVTEELLKLVQSKISDKIVSLKTEQCFNICLADNLSNEKLSVLKWQLQETYEPGNLGGESFIGNERKEGFNAVVVEVGPRLSFTTAWSANAVSICHACGLSEVNRLERSKPYLLYVKAESAPLLDSQIIDFAAMVHDRMTECVYPDKLPVQNECSSGGGLLCACNGEGKKSIGGN
ncbi:hypothetical protein QVD17_01306 [Tagetes erecta]|uniref:Phosphoribosylformylglycinamidine synthase N-terminal domain-containing protein n=1 Tax=Tagetes erecta TaxID=13708 RepID=A0AAD8P1D1_TARER|nr:hypothetical protein QVD17_01306 [Tagetes erecta]